jgi:NDP-sugar pyrophosphorylase family protein
MHIRNEHSAVNQEIKMQHKALILAAGLGTRLKPVTDFIPKALVVVDGKPLLEHALLHVAASGIHSVIINIHHFPDQIIEFLKANDHFGLDITLSDESDQLLETGGGLKKAAWYFDDGMPFLVRNADVLSDLDLNALFKDHETNHALATLAVRTRETSRYFLFDEHGSLAGWENRRTGERKITRPANPYTPYAFSGIQVVSPEIFPLITETGKFSLTDLYLRLSADHFIHGFHDANSFWMDAGILRP